MSVNAEKLSVGLYQEHLYGKVCSKTFPRQKATSGKQYERVKSVSLCL